MNVKTSGVVVLAPKPPEPPKPPSVFDVVEQPKPVQSSLFQSILGGDWSRLLEDVTASPEHYDSEVLEVLQRLANGAKLEDITPHERELLDRATIDFASFRPQPKPKAAPTVAKARAVTQAPEDVPIPGVDIPFGADPFWWDK